MDNKRMLVAGYGEVGKAITNVLRMNYEVDVYDIKDEEAQLVSKGTYDFIHICFPYSERFLHDVKTFKWELKNDGILIIHSTVPVGTSDKLGAVFSPVRGKHPHLTRSLFMFTKFFGGPKAQETANIFADIGIDVEIAECTKSLEAAKLWDTTQYGRDILTQKEIHEYCQKNGLDFDTVYTDFNITYNIGYSKCELYSYARPVLNQVDGPISGHCVVENSHLLDSPIAKEIIEKNKEFYEKDKAN